YIQRSPHAADIRYEGRVGQTRKRQLLQQAHVICATSIKEGWGLTVSEAASQGTPAVVYNVDGLRDSVQHEQTGLVVPATPAALAAGVLRLLEDKRLYKAVRRAAWRWAQQLTFDRSYQEFKHITIDATEGAAA